MGESNEAAATLRSAAAVVTGARRTTYGKPERNFGVIAEFWSTYLGHKVRPDQAAMMMALLKIARSVNDAQYMDNVVDGAGYLALAGELAGEGEA